MAQTLWMSLWDPDSPKPGIEPVFLALQGRFLTTEPPVKSPIGFFVYHFTNLMLSGLPVYSVSFLKNSSTER